MLHISPEKTVGLVEWFNAYASSFSLDDDDLAFNITLKIDHTHRVVSLMRDIAACEGLDDGLAAACALFHDVGRFEQFRKFRTFVDARSVNHACLSLEVMRDNRVLHGFSDPVMTIVEESVLHHNKAELPEALSHEVLPYLCALRDADKLDILEILCSHYESPASNGRGIELGLPDTTAVSDAVIDAIAARRIVRHAELANVNDFKLLQLGWVHDLNTRRACEIFKKRNYLGRIRKALPEHREIDAVVAGLRDVLDERVQ